MKALYLIPEPELATYKMTSQTSTFVDKILGWLLSFYGLSLQVMIKWYVYFFFFSNMIFCGTMVFCILLTAVGIMGRYHLYIQYVFDLYFSLNLSNYNGWFLITLLIGNFFSRTIERKDTLVSYLMWYAGILIPGIYLTECLIIIFGWMAFYWNCLQGNVVFMSCSE